MRNKEMRVTLMRVLEHHLTVDIRKGKSTEVSIALLLKSLLDIYRQQTLGQKKEKEKQKKKR